MGLFEGKTVIITGAGGGLGRCHALAFAKEGADVVVNDTGQARDGTGENQGLADSVVAEIRAAGGSAIAHTASIAERAGATSLIEAAADHFGRIDALVNNAGILRDRTIKKMNDDEWDAVMAVHARGTFLCTQAAARFMMDQGEGGAIVNTSSTSGLIGNFGQSNYGAAKAGIAGFTRVASIEFARYQIRVNAIAPIAKTRMTEELDSVSSDLIPEKVSPLVVYLASPLAQSVSGRIFCVYGGMIQEFMLMTTEGVQLEEHNHWTPESIHASWDRITDQAGMQPALRAFLNLL